MHYSELRHGDVLIYEYREGQSIYAKLITLITGSKYAHCSVVLEYGKGRFFVLEQMTQRMHSMLEIYNPKEIVHCVRPKFTVSKFVQPKWFERKTYGYANIADALINHFIGVFLRNWRYRPYFSKKWKNPDCSTLVSIVLNLKLNTRWVEFDSVVEPDDFYNHDESFEYLGEVKW